MRQSFDRAEVEFPVIMHRKFLLVLIGLPY
jgi:hypothetical protein